MSNIEKTFTNDENYQKIVNLYGADFVEKYYSVFNKVYGLIDISDYNIDDVQKNKLFSNTIKKYIAINKYLAFKNWNNVKLMFDIIIIDYKIEDMDELYNIICKDVKNRYPDYKIDVLLDFDMSD